jgi:prophage tail gpP-like protein
MFDFAKLLEIEIEGRRIGGWSKASWDISQESTSQSASLEMFCDVMPDRPVYPNLVKGAKVKFLLNGYVKITGEIETRKGKLSKESYSLAISIKSATEKGKKGKAKFRKGQAKDVKLKDIFQEIADNAEIKIDVDGIPDETKAVYNCLGTNSPERELYLLALNNGIHLFADESGKYKVQEDSDNKRGDDLIQGLNFTEFDIGQGEEKEASEVASVGTKALTDTVRRDETITSLQKSMMNSKGNGKDVFFVEGDAGEETLKRVSRYLANRKAAASNGGTLEVFSPLQSSGKPWQAGAIHYVQVPSESLYDDMLLKSESGSVSKDSISCSLTICAKKGMSNKEGDIGGNARGVLEMKRRGISLNFNSYPFPWNAIIEQEIING